MQTFGDFTPIPSVPMFDDTPDTERYVFAFPNGWKVSVVRITEEILDCLVPDGLAVESDLNKWNMAVLPPELYPGAGHLPLEAFQMLGVDVADPLGSERGYWTGDTATITGLLARMNEIAGDGPRREAG